MPVATQWKYEHEHDTNAVVCEWGGAARHSTRLIQTQKTPPCSLHSIGRPMCYRWYGASTNVSDILSSASDLDSVCDMI